jgi:hypothetical protein
MARSATRSHLIKRQDSIHGSLSVPTPSSSIAKIRRAGAGDADRPGEDDVQLSGRVDSLLLFSWSWAGICGGVPRRMMISAALPLLHFLEKGSKNTRWLPVLRVSLSQYEKKIPFRDPR